MKINHFKVSKALYEEKMDLSQLFVVSGLISNEKIRLNRIIEEIPKLFLSAKKGEITCECKSCLSVYSDLEIRDKIMDIILNECEIEK